LSTQDYIEQKYSYLSGGKLPTSFLQDELLLSEKEVRKVVSSFIGKPHAPLSLSLALFVGVVKSVLEY